MAGLGAGYDLSVSTISPDGRVFQVEYAAKAVDQGCTVLGAVCNDGVVLAVQRPVLSPCAVPGTACRLFAVDRHCLIAAAGFAADGMELVSRARQEAREYLRVFGRPIPGRVLAERIAYFVHIYTLAGSERPFGAAILLAVSNLGAKKTACKYGTATATAGAVITTTTTTANTNATVIQNSNISDEEMTSVVNINSVKNPDLPVTKLEDSNREPCSRLQDSEIKPNIPPPVELYSIDNAGVCYRYYGVALGKGKQAAKTALERLPLNQISSRESLLHLATITLQSHDESRLREETEPGSLVEMAWICQETNWNHQPVPSDLLHASEAEARRRIEADEAGSDGNGSNSSPRGVTDAVMQDPTNQRSTVED